MKTVVNMKDGNGNIRLSATIGEAYEGTSLTVKEEGVSLKFKFGETVSLKAGDEVELEGGNAGVYKLADNYEPVRNESEEGYDYELWAEKVVESNPVSFRSNEIGQGAVTAQASGMERVVSSDTAMLSYNNTFTAANYFNGKTTFNGAIQVNNRIDCIAYADDNSAFFSILTYAAIPNSTIIGFGRGNDRNILKMGMVNNAYVFTDSGFIFDIAGVVKAQRIEISGDTILKGNVAVSGETYTKTITHNTGVNLQIGNSLNPNYVDFVEDVRFNRNTYFNSGLSAGAITTRIHNTYDIGTSITRFRSIYCNAVFATGYSQMSSVELSTGNVYSAENAADDYTLHFGYSRTKHIKLYANSSNTGSNECMMKIDNDATFIYNRVFCASTISATNISDKRLKTNLQEMDAHAKLMSLGKVYEFDYTDEALALDSSLSKHHFGLIAQNVEQSCLSHIVHPIADGSYKGLDYINADLIALLVASGQQSVDRFVTVETRQSVMDKQIKALEQEVSRLNTLIK